MTLTVLLAVALLAAGIRASPQGDDSAKANRNSLLLRRGNVGRPLGRTTPTTTTTTTPSSADYAEVGDEYADNYDEGKGEDGADDGGEEGPAGGKQPTTTTTTTEAPKKIRPSIRPFRSNDDLLTALKKRRQESKNSKPAVAPKEKVYDDEDVPAPAAPAKSAKAPAIVPNKRRFGSGAARKDDHSADASSNDGHDGGSDGGSSSNSSNGAKSLIGRLGRSRFALKQ
uniref:Uncharacterized protein n=1 Tax=Anopheles stephensi TaxID=30069 RepID=A0A182YCM4_ANOST